LSGYLRSTTLAEWLKLQLGNGTWNGQPIVACDALQETHTPQIQNGTDYYTRNPAYYGLGWNVSYESAGKPMYTHSGAFFLGAGTAVRFSPSDQLGITVLTNAVPRGLAEAVTTTFFDLYRYGQPSQDWLAAGSKVFEKLFESIRNSTTDYSSLTPPSSPAAAKPPSAYIGSYSNAYYGQIEISGERGVLYLRLPAKGTRYNLNHWDGDTFTYRYDGDQDIARGVKFSFGSTPQVLIENLALKGNGVFLRLACLKQVATQPRAIACAPQDSSA
jgi:hypothetical protein